MQLAEISIRRPVFATVLSLLIVQPPSDFAVAGKR